MTDMMFNRKKLGEQGGIEMSQESTRPQSGEGTPPGKFSVRPPGVDGHDSSLMGASKSGPMPSARPGIDVFRRGVDISNPSKGERTSMSSESKKLIVGRDISLNGRISSCDRLVVEGCVEAELHDCHTIEIAESGTFKGAAEIEGAEISGHYEGSLTVREHLLIHSTGHVNGTIRYGRIKIEQGGEINGDVKSLGAKVEKPSRHEPMAAPAPVASKPAIPTAEASAGKG